MLLDIFSPFHSPDSIGGEDTRCVITSTRGSYAADDKTQS